jgi:hypothetical protein
MRLSMGFGEGHDMRFVDFLVFSLQLLFPTHKYVAC